MANDPTPIPARPHTVAIIQARMGSSRLPGKVLLDIAGRPMLGWVIERTRRASLVDEVVLATTTDPSDDPVADYCQSNGYAYTRGSLGDVLDRYYQAAQAHQAEVIARVTADCPLIDPTLIDDVIGVFLGAPPRIASRLEIREAENPESRLAPYPFDFAANRLPPPFRRSYPVGLDVEVCSFTALERAWLEARQGFEREHVMPYFYSQPGRFRFVQLQHAQDFGSLRWTVDTAQDLTLIQEIFNRLPDPLTCSWLDVLQIIQSDPSLSNLNAQVKAKSYQDVDSRLKPEDLV
ncbi:MAG TPA: glycosyltransferase family protein [Anaerolineales bacterium]|nr:glycosyltransferase family protein [Anaerolineales bacterium]